MGGIPPENKIPEVVKAILAFMRDSNTAKQVIECLPAVSEIGSQLKISNGATKQGRYMLQIEGDIPREYTLKVLKSIDDLNGDIQIVAGK